MTPEEQENEKLLRLSNAASHERAEWEETLPHEEKFLLRMQRYAHRAGRVYDVAMANETPLLFVGHVERLIHYCTQLYGPECFEKAAQFRMKYYRKPGQLEDIA